MAIERVLELMQENEMTKAAEHALDGANFLKEGKGEDAELKLAEATKGIGKARFIDSLRSDILTRLERAGIEQLPAESLRGLFTQRMEQTPPAEPSERGERRVRGDFGSTEEKYVHALFAINPDRSNFENPSWRSVVRHVHTDVLDQITDRVKKRTKEYNLDGAASQAKMNIIKKIQTTWDLTENIPPHIAEFYKWIKGQPEFASLNRDDLIAVIERKITFGEVLQIASQKAEDQSPRQAPDNGIPSVEPVTTIDIQAIQDLDETEKKLVENLPQDPKSPVTRTALATKVFPVQAKRSIPTAKTYLRRTMVGVEGKLASQGISIVNPVSTIERRNGVEASFYLARTSKPAEESDLPMGDQDGTINVTGTERADQEISNKLTDQDIYYLAKDLSNQERLERVRLKITDDDKEAITGMRDSRETGQEEESPSETRAREILYLKLRIYLHDKPGFFMANLENGDAQFLLAAIAQIESEERLKQLLGIPLEGEKK